MTVAVPARTSQLAHLAECAPDLPTVTQVISSGFGLQSTMTAIPGRLGLGASPKP